jgi:hypothetical protein
MSRVGFEPTIPVFERAKMVHAVDSAATVIGIEFCTYTYIIYNLITQGCGNIRIGTTTTRTKVQ